MALLLGYADGSPKGTFGGSEKTLPSGITKKHQMVSLRELSGSQQEARNVLPMPDGNSFRFIVPLPEL
jgi:hypothetical protein